MNSNGESVFSGFPIFLNIFLHTLYFGHWNQQRFCLLKQVRQKGGQFPIFGLTKFFVRQVRFCGLLVACSSLFLRSLFALPSLQGREDNIGFRGICVKQTCAYAACRAGFTYGGGADFV
jgi:hypothetical protein